ncbi:MAG TPA: deoxyribose-phosphate aldolase [Gemmatimonadaceae bacterium]|nr:deoxyribose-phosphate aldolase [Gemmatimonadaceae bacterium]
MSSIDLNALAAQLASQLSTPAEAERPTGHAGPTGTTPVSGAEAILAPPRGVTFAPADARLGDFLDHTLLRPDATLPDVERLCAEALAHRLAAVCVNPVWVPDCARLLRGSAVRLVTVIGFPFGATRSEIKAAEAALAVQEGAQELDVVVPLGALRNGEWEVVERDMAAVVRAAEGALVKVVLESALLTPFELVTACLAARDAGADYVKTSTGFHTAGGATVETVALMRLAIGDTMGVKASGGIRDGATALAMLAAGATRIGTSAGPELAEVRGLGPRPLRELLSRRTRAERTTPVPSAAAAAVTAGASPTGY